MAMFLFADAIMKGTPIKLFNHGRMRRDFTYIDDVTRVVSRLIDRAQKAAPVRRLHRPNSITSAITAPNP